MKRICFVLSAAIILISAFTAAHAGMYYVNPTDADGQAIQGLFDEDKIVGLGDFLQFVRMFGKTYAHPRFERKYDLDNDGRVGLGDFFRLVANYGKVAVNYVGLEIVVDLPHGNAPMEMVWIEPGTFTMGSPLSESGRGSDEGPQHRVTITQGFYLGKYEITQWQWYIVMGTFPWYDRSNVREIGTHPAVYMSWNDMQEFIRRLNVAEGSEVYRLPTEAEWEYACRAGTMTQWSFGDDESRIGQYGWYLDNACDVGECYAHAVGTRLPNPWGLHDMYGNVLEWCQDLYSKDYYSESLSAAPTGPSTGRYRVLRGGGFVSNAQNVRSAARYAAPSITNPHFGARLLRQEAGNHAPVSDTGPDHTANIGDTVTLDGSGSRDPDGDALTYRWTQTGGPAVTLSGTTTVRVAFTLVGPGIYVFSLIVNDGMADSAADEVTVTVEPAASSHREAATFTLPGNALMEMVWIEPGTFTMGSPLSESDRQWTEGPQHRVTITQGFWLGKYEITQEQWRSVMGTSPWSGERYVQVNVNHPAVYISWNDMQEFIRRLNVAEGSEVYRLPTEAEWEYACRAGTTTRYWFGDDKSRLGDYAWYRDNDAGERYAREVGTKLRNSRGVYDMHGNVHEWCQDRWGSYLSSSQVDPTGPATGSSHVNRGGSFRSRAQDVRSASRSVASPGLRNHSIGARLLREDDGH